MEDIKVSVIMLCYKHEKYVAKALDSVLSQKTDFKFEIIIQDDASPDSSADIIREYQNKYPDVIQAILQTENQFGKGESATDRMTRLARGEYIALCECDDFWCDETKLQQQVDFLDAHRDYSICGHAGYNAYENGEYMKRTFRPQTESGEIKLEKLLVSWVFPTASIVYRLADRNPFEIPFKKGAPCGDYPLIVYMALHGKAYYMDRFMSVYRRYSSSSLSKKRMRERNMNNPLRFARMLDGIDEYTGGAYHAELQAYKEKVLLAGYIKCGDLKGIKEAGLHSLYKKDRLKNSIKLFLYKFFPQIAVYMVEHR